MAARMMLHPLLASATSWTLEDALLQESGTPSAQKLISDIRDWCQKNAILQDASDALLVAFLHSCFYDFEKTTKTMQVYHSIRGSTPEVFENRSFHEAEVQAAKTVGYFCILPNKTPEGYRVILQSLRNSDPSVFVYSASSKAQFLTIDACVRAEPTAAGYAFLYDMQGVQMGHMWKWGPFLSRKIFRYLQEGMPLRMKRIHFLNVSPIMGRVMRVISPFINSQLQDLITQAARQVTVPDGSQHRGGQAPATVVTYHRGVTKFHFHTANDMDQFFNIVPRHCVPENYGGSLPPLNVLQDESDWFLNQMDDLIP